MASKTPRGSAGKSAEAGKDSAARKPARKSTGKKTAHAAPKLSHLRKPSTLDFEDWQRALRRQFGREQSFSLERLGDEPVFADFRVGNPDSGNRWLVSIRGSAAGANHCTCPDFASNDLGTCKHIEFTLARLAARRGGKAALARGFVAPYSELVLQRGPQQAIVWRPGSDCPPALAAKAQALFDAQQRLPLARVGELDAFIGAAEAAGHALRVHGEVLDFAARCSDDARRRQALAAAYPRGAADPALAAVLRVPLYPYQAEGALFAAHAGRVLIADDMGLGKTAQAIAAAELLARHAGVERVLVVCPTSLKHQWQREMARFAGRGAQVVQGMLATRQAQWRDEAPRKITNYESLLRDIDDIRAWGPQLLVIDEAQRVKNWNTQAARALRRLDVPHVIVLTGTPLENRLEELLAIVQLVDQQRLGPTWRLRAEHQVFNADGRVVGYRQLDKLGQTLQPVMLRRRKAEVLAQLPERLTKTLFVPLTDAQRQHHDDAAKLVGQLVARWKRTGFLSDVDQRRLMSALQTMRMACDSTWLVDHETDHGHKADELMAVLDELFEQPDAKAVVFSQWLGMHEVLQRRLQARGWGHVLFHGGVPGAQRGALVDRFHQDPECRLFLSTDAGGVGLNLQHAAATVINMDLPWNPAVLAQRVGRVHRMGQQRGVQVIHFVAEDSIEHGMMAVLAFKQSLAEGVLDGGQAEVLMQGTRLASFMKTVGDVTGAMSGAARSDASAQPDAAANDDGLAAGTSTPTTVAEPTTTEDGKDAAALAGESELPPPQQPPGAELPAPSSKGSEAVAEPATVDASAAQPAAAATAADDPPDTPAGAGSTPGASAPSADPWAPLIDAGLRLLADLAQPPATASGPSADVPPAAGAERFVQHDAATGRRQLVLPLPEPAAVRRLAEGLVGLLEGLRGQR